jgi:hypothetical protein
MLSPVLRAVRRHSRIGQPVHDVLLVGVLGLKTRLDAIPLNPPAAMSQIWCPLLITSVSHWLSDTPTGDMPWLLRLLM